MQFEWVLPDGPVAYVFPGQGAHTLGMLDPFRTAPRFAEYYQQICALIGGDPLAIAMRDPEFINGNLVSSLLTVLASVACLDLLKEKYPSYQPQAVAGYSVGQWVALYAGGNLGLKDLFDVVAKRAHLMDQCVAAAPPSGMLAVLGLRDMDIEAVCREISQQGELLQISNYNAPGQYTLAGSEAGLRSAAERLASLRPKKLFRLAVAGAWHSKILEPIVEPLNCLLKQVQINSAYLPIIDNTTGTWLPIDMHECRAHLARQVAHPVLWMQGIRTMAAFGVRSVVEVGFGDTLTKFGFFVDRSLRHQALVPLPRARS